MTLSPEEFSEGQKAYWRLQAYQRANPTSLLWLAAFIMPIQSWQAVLQGHYWAAVWGPLVLVVLPWGLYRSKNRARKDFEFLGQLKAKYGPEIYEEIKTEPTSLRFKLLQKVYPPTIDRRAVQLP